MSVVVLDPGTTTGMIYVGQNDSVSKYQLPHDEVPLLMLQLDPAAVVYERFVIMASSLRKSRAGMHDALNLIGWVEHEGLMGRWQVESQLPVQGKAVPNDTLKELGLYWPGHVHYNDAARHYTIWAARKGKLT